MSDDAAAILEWFLIVFGAIGIVVGAVEAYNKAQDILTALPRVLGAILDALGASGFFLSQLGVPAGLVIVAAVASALATFFVVLQFYLNRCTVPLGAAACSSGVVEHVTVAFDSIWNEIFPFSAIHPRVDVVVKKKYWPLVVLNGPPFVRCAACDNCPAEVRGAFPQQPCSPMLACFYHSDKVCAAALGSVIGAGVGAVVGAIGGAVAGVAVLIICGALLFLCLVLAIFVAIVVAVAATLIGAFIGGQIAKASAEDDERARVGTVEIAVGDYITTVGNLISSGFVNGANAYWFVGWIPTNEGSVEDQTEQTHSGTMLHGRSTGNPPFCFTDPEANLITDGCGNLG